MNQEQFLTKFDQGWEELAAAYAGLSQAQLSAPGVSGAWSVKDTLAHISTWEGEALKYLPLLLAGGTPPRYAAQYGGLNAFNALMEQQKKSLAWAEVVRQMDDTHQKLRAYVEQAPAEAFASETRFRRRLRLESYGHYRLHAGLIRAWREGQGV